MRHRGPARVALAACAAWSVLVAPAVAQGVDAAQRQALVAQKLKLADQVVGSARAQEVQSGGDADAKAALAKARELLAQARQGGEPAEVEARVNEALRLATLSTRGRAAAPPAADGQARSNAEKRAQVEEYRRGMVAALQAQRNSQDRSPMLVAVDQQLAEADELSRAGRHADAAAQLEKAYRSAVQGLARLREGETVTIALKFETPADEYAYEQKRFHSHDMLVDLTLAERNPTGTMRHAVEQRRQDARGLRDQAAANAERGDYKAAIGQLEEATRNLVRALQAAGVTGLY